MPTSVMNRRLLLDRDRIQGFFLEHIRRLIRINNFCGVKHERVWDLVYDTIFLDPVTTRHFSQFQLMWPHRRSRSLAFREWWAAFHTYMGPMIDRTSDQTNNWRWDNPRAFGDRVDCSNRETTSLGRVKSTGERFSWYGSDDCRTKIAPPSCRRYEPGDLLAVRLLISDAIFDEDDNDENWADPGVPSGGRRHPGDGNDNDNGEGEENTQGSEKGTGKGKGTKDGMGKWKGKGKAMEEGKGKGKVIGKGKGIVN